MAILGKVSERIKGAFKFLLGGAAAVGLTDLLKGMAKEKGIEAASDFVRSLATGKGLNNEANYGYIIDRCNLKTKERELLIKSIQELRKGSEEEKEAANNFIIEVSLGSPDKNGKRPGERIIHGFIHRICDYSNETKQVQMIKNNVIHLGTDAEVKKKIAMVQKWAMEAWNQVEDFIEPINKLSDKYKRYLKRELDEYQKRPWWKKLLLN